MTVCPTLSVQGFRRGGGGSPDPPTQHQRGDIVGQEKYNILHILLTFHCTKISKSDFLSPGGWDPQTSTPFGPLPPTQHSWWKPCSGRVVRSLKLMFSA